MTTAGPADGYDRIQSQVIPGYGSLARLAVALLAAARSAEQKIACCEQRPEYFLRAASIRSQLQDLSAARTLLQIGCEKFPAHERLAACYQELSAAN